MITLCMDTSHKFLALALLRDDELIGKYQVECFKRQSEIITEQLEKMVREAGYEPMDIDQVVITRGPGSYTGVRIAMTIAKVICALRSIPLYTLDTLQLYSDNRENVDVVMDARGSRVYWARYNEGEEVIPPCVEDIDKVEAQLSNTVLGDGSLVGKEDVYPDLCEAFLHTKKQWKKVENVHTLTPEYLKSAEAYMVKKNA